MQIFFIGFMAAGKSTIGELLAAQLARPFVDLDAEIEARAGMSVREIFDTLGEPVFRDLEHRALKFTLELPGAVVATGGGTVTFERNVDLMRRSGVSVWLNPPFSTIAERIAAHGKPDRPLFKNEAQALELYCRRLPAYRRADLQIDIRPDEQPQEVAARVVLMLRGRNCSI